MAGRKNLGGVTAQNLIHGRAKKFFDGRADQHRAAFVSEKDQPVVKARHNLMQILAQGAENFTHATKLFTQASDLGAHLSEFIARCC